MVIGFWLLYKLVFDLIIPLYRGTKVMRSKIREMQEQINKQATQDNFNDPSEAQKARPNAPQGDYIEFEEVK